MATNASDGSASRESPRLPVSLHPAFPAVVALWFAALLGFGSLLLPGVLFDRVIEAVGIASLLPAAAPPLGFTARALITLIFGLAGAALGFAIARRVARSQAEIARTRLPHIESGTSADIEVSGEAPGEDPSADRTASSSRRRALAIADIEPLAGFPETSHIGAQEPDVIEPVVDSIAAPVIHWRAEENPGETHEMADMQESQTASGFAEWREPEETFSEPEAAETAPSEPVHDEWDRASLDDLGLMQLVQRLASTMEKRREWLASTRMARAAAPEPGAPFSPAPAEEAAQAKAAYFEPDLAADPAPSPTEEPPALLRPAFLDWFDGDNDDEEDESPFPVLSIPLRAASGPTLLGEPEDEDPDVEPDAGIEDEDVYGSLIEMKNPFAAPRSDFIRIEEPELEPGPDAGAPEEAETSEDRPYRDDTDAALRAALANLQRMSGAA